MELVLREGDREERAKVQRRGDGVFEVTIGERQYLVDAARVGATLRTLLIEGRQHEVAVRALDDGRYMVAANGSTVEVEASDPLTFLARQSHREKGGRGAHTVKAYMPGRVVNLLVAEGDEVQAGQGLLVLEAMKMQNEIQAERAGKVRKVLIAAGQAVEGGDPLLELE